MLTSGTSRLALLAVLGALLAAAPAASAAAQRYASPTGSGAACTSASPCTITSAVNGASDGDEVIVTPGDYPLTAGSLGTPAQITIQGVAGQPRPRLMFSNLGQSGLHVQFGSTLRYVEVDQAAPSLALYAYASTVDQVIARGTAPGYQTAEIDNSTIRNSIVVASGDSGVAIETDGSGTTSTSTYRNVTAIATGSGAVAIEARAELAAGNATINLTNVIAHSTNWLSLEPRTDNSGAHATIITNHTNSGATATVGTNAVLTSGPGAQGGAAFVNAAAGDYREAPGSPTINAGANDPLNGPLDVDGNPRTIGTTDIGAYEFVVAPGATTGPASAVTDQSATLNGSVDPQGAPASYRFEYGTTTAYGSTTPSTDASSGGAVAAAATLGGLSPATTYHYRVVATNAGGVTNGADQTFTTASPPPPASTSTATTSTSTTSTASTSTATTSPSTTSTSTTTAPGSAFAGVKLVSARLSFGAKFVTLKLTCPAGTVARCSGRTKLTVRRRAGSGAASSVVLGRAPFSIAAARQGTIKVRISATGRRLLSGVDGLSGRDTNATRDGAGQSKTTVAAVSIRRRHH